MQPRTPATSASRWRPHSTCTFQLRAPGGSGLWRRVCCRCAAAQRLPFALKVSSPSHTTFSSLSRAALCPRCCRLAPLAAPQDGAHSSRFSLVCPTLCPFIPHFPTPDLLGVMFEAFSEFAARRPCHSMHTYNVHVLTILDFACAKSCSLRKSNLKRYVTASTGSFHCFSSQLTTGPVLFQRGGGTPPRGRIAQMRLHCACGAGCQWRPSRGPGPLGCSP